MTRDQIRRWRGNVAMLERVGTLPDNPAWCAAERARMVATCPHPFAVSDSEHGPRCPDCGSPLPAPEPRTEE